MAFTTAAGRWEVVLPGAPAPSAMPVQCYHTALDNKDPLHIKHCMIRNICNVLLVCSALYASVLMI